MGHYVINGCFERNQYLNIKVGNSLVNKNVNRLFWNESESFTYPPQFFLEFLCEFDLQSRQIKRIEITKLLFIDISQLFIQ